MSGVLFVLAMSSLAVYAVVLAGWSSGSKYPLLGGVRATAQAISYEAAMGLAMVAVVMFSSTSGDGGTLSLAGIVERQAGTFADVFPNLAVIAQFIPRWNLIPQFVAFVIFFLAIIAETNRSPFDLVEAEQELVGGFHTEYSGMRFAMYQLAEYSNIFSMCAICSSLFLGGWNGPTWDGTLPALISGVLPTFWLLVKTYVLFFILDLAAGHAASYEIRPADAAGMEAAHSGRTGLAHPLDVVIGIRQFGLPWNPSMSCG